MPPTLLPPHPGNMLSHPGAPPPGMFGCGTSSVAAGMGLPPGSQYPPLPSSVGVGGVPSSASAAGLSLSHNHSHGQLQPGLGQLQPNQLQPGLGQLQPSQLQPGLGHRGTSAPATLSLGVLPHPHGGLGGGVARGGLGAEVGPGPGPLRSVSCGVEGGGVAGPNIVGGQAQGQGRSKVGQVGGEVGGEVGGGGDITGHDPITHK